MIKPTKTQAEISKLEKQIAKLHGDLAQKRRLEALRAEADALQKAIKAEPCDKPHYPSPCPLPHSPWTVGPWLVGPWGHAWSCHCSTCQPSYPYGATYNTPVMTTTPNIGEPITIYGGTANNGTVSVFNANSNLATGTQMGADGVPFTYTGATVSGNLMTTPTHLGVPYNEASPFQIERALDYDPYANKMES